MVEISDEDFGVIFDALKMANEVNDVVETILKGQEAWQRIQKYQA
jgi:hypothetical protein